MPYLGSPPPTPHKKNPEARPTNTLWIIGYPQSVLHRLILVFAGCPCNCEGNVASRLKLDSRVHVQYCKNCCGPDQIVVIISFINLRPALTELQNCIPVNYLIVPTINVATCRTISPYGNEYRYVSHTANFPL